MKSILNTEPGTCYWCGYVGDVALHHILPGNPRRRLCTQDGLVVFLCPRCHDRLHNNPNHGIDLNIKQDAQTVWERTYGNREDFIKRYGRSYL